MKKLVLSLILSAFAATSASAAFLDYAGASVVTHTATTVTFTAPNPTFALFTCVTPSGNCTGASFIYAGVANSFDGVGLDIVRTTFAGNTVDFNISSVTVGTILNGFVASLSGTYFDTGTIFGAGGTAGNVTITYQGNPSTFSLSGNPVPEPGSMALLGSGLLGLGFIARRRLKK